MMDRPGISTIHVLWARSDRYPEPHFVGAWSDGMVDAMHHWYLELRADAIRDFAETCETDGPWTFWMGVERIQKPTRIYESIDPASYERADA